MLHFLLSFLSYHFLISLNIKSTKALSKKPDQKSTNKKLLPTIDSLEKLKIPYSHNNIITLQVNILKNIHCILHAKIDMDILIIILILKTAYAREYVLLSTFILNN